MVHPDQRGMRHRAGERVEISLHHRTVWRRSLCADLHRLSDFDGDSHSGGGTFCGPWQPAQYRPRHGRIGAERHQMALV